MVFFIFLFLAVLLLFLSYRWASSGRVPADRLSEILHFETGRSSNTSDQTVFKVMTYNIGYLSGKYNNRPARQSRYFFDSNLKKVIALLKRVKPDIACFQEIDFNSHRSYGINQLRAIAIQSGFPTAALAVNWDKRYVPFPVWPPSVHFKDMLSGQAITSSFPIDSVDRIVLPEIQEKPFYYRGFYLDRLAQVATINLFKRTVVVINVHLEAFEEGTREKQAREVLSLYRRYRDQYPVILAGDFNCVPPWAAGQSGFSDEPDIDFRSFNIIRLFLEEPGLREAFINPERSGPEPGTFTFPSDGPNRKLDYIFYSYQDIRFLSAEVLQLDSSDHFPLVMEFCFLNPVD